MNLFSLLATQEEPPSKTIGGVAKNPCETGEITERKFELRAAELGWLVAAPRGMNRDFDAIIMRQGGRPVVVQVKRGKFNQKGGCRRYIINCSRRAYSGDTKSTLYGPTAFDVLAVHLPDVDKWVFYTRAELGNRKATSYSLPEHRLLSVKFSAPDARDPDNWELLDEVAQSFK